MQRIICIAGPTASGKTALAVALAGEFGGEVISCDSMQVYRGMDVGTAKPTPREMEGIPHHMLDVADPAENFSVGRFTEMADPILRDILSRGKTAILAGGTGLYMDSLISGRKFSACPETGVRQALEQRADREGTEALLRELAGFDPDAAARLHPADRRRIIRAMEVYYETGKTITRHNEETMAQPPRYRAAWLGLTYSCRQTLYDRIDRRVELMMEQGLAAEAERLLAAGVPAASTAMQAIGYKEIAAALTGQCTMEEAVAAVKQSSRRYAKRQLTWFRRNPEIFWLDRSRLEEGLLFPAARQCIRDFDFPQ